MRLLLIIVLLGLTACTHTLQHDTEPSLPERIVQAQLDAYNRRDLEAFLASYSADIKIYLHPATLQQTGLNAMREVYAQLFEKNPQLKCQVLQRMVHRNYVIDHEHLTGLADGKELKVIAIYEIKGGKIVNVWFKY